MPRPSRVERPVRPVDLVHRVALDEVLRRVADVGDHAEVRLQDRVAVPVGRVELELIGVGRATLRHVVSGGDANLVEDVVVEVVLVRTDARLLVRVDRERGGQILAAEPLRDERVDVGRVRGIVQGDERRIHVTGCARGRRQQQESRCSRQLQHASELFSSQ